MNDMIVEFKKGLHKMKKLYLILILLFLFSFSVFSLSSSGTLESEDSWLYSSVARNLYYTGKATAQPNEYSERKNVNMNSIQDENGEWYAPYAIGYSFSFLPAVALSDLYHTVTKTPVPYYHPLETDWSFFFFASLSHAVFSAVLVVLVFALFLTYGYSYKQSVIAVIAVVFLSNLFPLGTHSFPHILFIDAMVMAMLATVKFHQTQKMRWLIVFALSLAALSLIYNQTFFLVWIGLSIYFTVKNWRMISAEINIFRLLILPALFLIVLVPFLPKLFLYVQWLGLKPVITFQGVWGLLFSSGKSVFLYSPLLILPVIFWKYIDQKKWRAELAGAVVLTILYLALYSQAHLLNELGWFGIWHGGMAWGPRYLSPLIIWWMILTIPIIQNFSKIQKLFILTPVVIVSIMVQMLGVLLPYQTQYAGLPYNVFVNEQEVQIYDYASFIPRYSPLITQTKRLARVIIQFPKSINPGIDQVQFYDGFYLAHPSPFGIIRPFDHQGHLTWKNTSQKEQSIMIDLFVTDVNHASASAQLRAVLNDQTVFSQELSSTSAITLHLQGSTNTTQMLDFFLTPNASESTITVGINTLNIDGRSANLESISQPYLDYGFAEKQSRYPRKYYGEVNTDPWAYWHVRARVYENTPDLWWIRFWYYWDLPHGFISTLFVVIMLTLILSGFMLRRVWKSGTKM